MDYSLSAIILLSEPFNENDEIFTFFSPELGKFQAKAKSSKKIASKLKMSLRDFSLVNITFAPTWKSLIPTIIGCEIIKSFSNIKKSALKIFLTMYLSEILMKSVLKKEKNEFVYKLFYGALKKINDTSEKSLKSKTNTLIFFFMLKLLKNAGLEPEIKRCVVCGFKKNLFYFNTIKGGVLCKKCVKHEKKSVIVSKDVLKIINDFKEKNWQSVSNFKLSSFQNFILKKILIDFYQTHFDQKIFSPYILPI